MKILIIEDDRAISRAIAAALGSRYAFDQAFDGEEGLFFAQQNVYDLVVLDIMLPALDGYGVLERLRAACGSNVGAGHLAGWLGAALSTL